MASRVEGAGLEVQTGNQGGERTNAIIIGVALAGAFFLLDYAYYRYTYRKTWR